MKSIWAPGTDASEIKTSWNCDYFMITHGVTTARKIIGRSTADQTSSRKRPLINWSPIFGFDVFISYKRGESSPYAGSLERQLRDRDIHCFLDDNEIPAGSLLADTVRAALRRSRLLVVIVSPGSLHSKYVQDEIRTFAEYSQHIAPILFASSKALVAKAQTAELSPESAVLEILLKSESVWVDERERTTGLDNASPEVAEKIREVFGFLRANTLRRILLTVVFAAISIAAAVASFEAVIAQRERNIAVSRQLAAQSQLLREQPSALETRVLLAVESARLVPGIENDQALRESLYLLRKPAFAAQQADQMTVVTIGSHGLVATADASRNVRVFDSATGAEVSHWVQPNRVVSLAFGHDGHSLAIATLEGPSRLLDLGNGEEVAHVVQPQETSVAALSEDGRWLATASKNGTICVFELSSGREALRIAQVHATSVLAFSPDDRWIAAGGSDGVVEVFQRESGKKVSHLSHRGAVNAIAFSPNSRWIASGSNDGTTRVSVAANGEELPRPDPSGWRDRVPAAGGEPFSLLGIVRTVVFSPDNRLLATGNGDSTARIFDVSTGRELIRLAHGNLVDTVAFSPDARWIATGCLDSAARIFETSGGKEVAHLPEESPVHAVAFTSDGRRLATSTDKTLRIFEAPDGREVTRLPQQNLLTTALFSPDGHWLAVKTYDGQHIEILDTLRGTVVLNLPRRDLIAALTLQPLDLDKFKPTGKRLLYSGEDQPVAFSGDSQRLALADDNGARVFDLAIGKELLQVSDTEVKAVSFSPDGRWLATANADGTARIVEVATGTIVFSSTLEDGLSAPVFSPDSYLVATADGKQIVHVFAVSTGKEVARLTHPNAVEVLAFSPEGRRLATGTSDGTVRVFRVPTGQEVFQVTEKLRISTVAFSPDGHWLATGGDDRTARVFETDSGKEVSRMVHQAPVILVAFTVDSSAVASASYDYTVRVFEVATGRELTRLSLDGRVKAMRFLKDGRVLETASSGRIESEEAVSAKADFVSVQRHLLRADDLIEEACSRLTRNLTEEEWKQYWERGPHRKSCSQSP